MRIAVVCWSRRSVGGVESYLAEIAPALVSAGHDVAFWCEVDRPTERAPITLPPGVPVMCAETGGVDAALSDLCAWRPDLLYAHGLDDPAIEASVLTVAPSVLFLHGYYGTCISGSKTFKRPVITPCSREFGRLCLLHYFPHGCGGRSPVTMFREYRRQAMRLTNVRRYDAVVTHSTHMAAEFTKHGVSPRQVGYFASPPSVTQEVRGTDRDVWRLLFAGRMDRLKGGHVLLDALPQVRAGVDRNVRLTIAGDGPERSSLQRQAARLEGTASGLQIVFLGWVEPARLDVLMTEVDLLVVPSLWPEPFGSVGLSACYQGLPVVAFRVGGIPEWLTEGVNGCLAPGDPPTSDSLAHAIARCLSDPRRLRSLQQGAREIAGRFTMRAHLDALTDVFAEVVSTQQHRPSHSVAQ